MSVMDDSWTDLGNPPVNVEQTLWTPFCVSKGAASGSSSASLQAFDQIVAGSFQTYLDLSKKIGDEVANQSSVVESAFTAQRAFLVKAYYYSNCSMNSRQAHVASYNLFKETFYWLLITISFLFQGIAAGAKKPTDQELAVLVTTQFNLFVL